MTECCVNTLSWASIEGSVYFTRTWPTCAAASPSTTIFAPGFNSGTFTIKKRTQVVELFAEPKPCEEAQIDDKGDLPFIFSSLGLEQRSRIARYRYCTRVVSLIHVVNLLSRVTLSGPTFTFTTPSSFESRTMSPGGCMLHWNHPNKRHGLRDSFTLMNLDLGCLRFAHFGLSMRVTCLTIIEWEWLKRGGRETDMAREDPDSWQPNCAAGIVLIKSKGGQEDVHWDKNEEIYTRIGYWELVKWNKYRPPYGPLRKEAKVTRVTVV